ncbi:MAG TPA: methyl-accepting chemotaxis protein [Ramlibacter sp.]|jgi:methyl-accepting chemotaxis protein|nr:methyl-accepting chemotaxis protein [Ramlibacter sp.]
MQMYLNLSTRNKLLSAFGVIVAFIAVVIYFAWNGLSVIRDSERALFDVEFANVEQLKDVRNNQIATRGAVSLMMLSPAKEVSDALMADIAKRGEESNVELAAIAARIRADDPMQPVLREFRATSDATQETRKQQVMPLIFKGRVDEAKVLHFGVQADRDTKMRQLVDQLVDRSVQSAAAGMARSEQAAAESMRVLYLVAALTLICAIALTFLLTQALASPLTILSRAAQQAGTGDLRIELAATQRADETGVLNATFRQMIERMREMLRQLAEGVGVLSASANEITAATAQVTASSTQTASAVGETTATAEEVKQTAKVAAEKAAQVQEVAQKTVRISHEGLKAMDDSIQALHQIQQQMDAIAQSTMRLAEQGIAIGEIIATVSDLADQSNVLSVNAAIEAARAGEEGAGFRVVAQEIRSLSDQSKQATVQVRNLLGEIQKATSSAVMATEQGSKAVRSGVTLAEGAAQSIRAMAGGISESAHAATQIAASAQQQAIGMDQVAFAMQNINKASTQNVAASRQTEAAAQGLQSLGLKLNGLIAQYKA